MHKAFLNYDESLDDARRKPDGGYVLNSAECTTMCTYVDDVKMETAKKHKSTLWKVIRLMFDSEAARHADKFLGVVASVPIIEGTSYRITYSQAKYVINMVQEYEKKTGKKVTTKKKY